MIRFCLCPIRLVIAASIIATGSVQGAEPDVKPEFNRPGFKLVRNIEYAKEGGKPILLDVFTREKSTESLPTVVYIHGGGWKSGSKENCPVTGLLFRGYVVVSINYRLSNEALFPAQIHDCKGAIRFLRAHAQEYNIDPKRIGVWGFSAGAHLAALLGTSGSVKELEGTVGGNLEQSSSVQCVAESSGPTDFLNLAPGQTPGIPSQLASIKALLGGPLAEKKALAIMANPITYITKDDPPFLIFHGLLDPGVPPAQSQLLYDALKAGGVDATLHMVPEGKHSLLMGKDAREINNKFFDVHLKPTK